MGGDILRCRYSVLAILAFCTLVLLFSTSAHRFRFAEWSENSGIDISGQFKYQETVVAGPPVQIPAPSSTHDSPSTNPEDGLKSSELDSHHAKTKRIVGMIFAGRKEYVSILDCYLQRNLLRNGGWLDEVMWILHVNQTADIVYLHDLTDSVPEYTLHEIYTQEEDELKPFRDAYRLCRPDTIYVKIDDDVLFMEDNAIQAIVQRKIDKPHYLMVSANVLNQPAASWVQHHHLNASKPYLPETSKPDDFVDDDRRHMVDWRPSTLPAWDGIVPYILSMAGRAPFKGHRWLPLVQGDIGQTPVGALAEAENSTQIRNSTDYHPWTVAAQQHYSFLENLEKAELSLYKFDLWTYNSQSRNINFIAFSGDDVAAHPVDGDDDYWWTVKMPTKLGRPAVVDGTAIAVHFGTRSQTSEHDGIPGRGLRDTDLLRRYRSYATEFICGKPWGSPMG